MGDGVAAAAAMTFPVNLYVLILYLFALVFARFTDLLDVVV